jgi:hypothetical protein
MPKKETPKQLNAVAFSKQEVDAAKQVLLELEGDSAAKRKAESNMSYYLKSTGELVKGDRLAGDRRRDYLLLFLAKQARDKNAVVSAKSSHTVSKKSLHQVKKIWWGKRQMVDNLGETRALSWIECGKLDKRPCPVTGKDDEDHSEWHCPQDEDVDQHEDHVQVGEDTHKTLDGESSVKDLEAQLADMGGNLVPAVKTAQENGIVVKIEAGAPESDPALELPILKDTKGTLRKLRDIEMEIKVLRDVAQNVPYASMLCNDMHSFLPKLTTAIKATEKLMLNASATDLNMPEVKRLDLKVVELKQKFEIMHSWGVKFGIVPNKRSKK